MGDLNGATPPSMSTTPTWLAPLVITFAMQTLSAFLLRVPPVIGPSVTAAAGVAPEYIGILSGLTAGGTMWFLLNGSVVLRYLGPVRTLQLGAFIGAGATLLAITGQWWLLIISAVVIGIGYGPSPPAGSEILTRASPPNRRSLIMSIKQSGVPLGGALAGLMLPPIVEYAGWRWALVVAALFALVAVPFVQPWRAQLDVEREHDKPPTLAAIFSLANMAAPFTALRAIPGMVAVSYAGFCFACVQGCLLTFFVTQLASEIGFSLTLAGYAFAAMQISGVVARVIMGWVADKIGGLRALTALSVTSFAMVLVVSRIAIDWPFAAVTLVGLIAGFTSTSWNGVYLAEVARLAPPGKIGEATSGSTILVFAGYLSAPIVFTFALPYAGSYGACFAVLALVPLSVAIALGRRVFVTRS
jgi:MFS family permease